MKRVLKQASLFAITGLALLSAFEALTFELPREPMSDLWRDRALAHGAIVVGLTVVAFFGSAFGFRLLPATRILRKRAILAIGAIFAFAAFTLLAPAVESFAPLAPTVNFGGVLIAIPMSLLLAAVVAFVGGRVLSRNAA